MCVRNNRKILEIKKSLEENSEQHEAFFREVPLPTLPLITLHAWSCSLSGVRALTRRLLSVGRGDGRFRGGGQVLRTGHLLPHAQRHRPAPRSTPVSVVFGLLFS